VARDTFADMSKPIDNLKKSIIGNLADLQNDKTISDATLKLFDPRSMDKHRMAQAAKLLNAKDPTLMRRAVGGFINDTFEGLRKAQGGDVINAAGKMNKAIFGSKKQEEMIKAALDPSDFDKLKDLFTILEVSAKGQGSESMTMPFAEMQRTLEGSTKGPINAVVRGGLTLGKSIRDSALNKWNDIIMQGNQQNLFVALTDPEVLGVMRRMKPLKPESKRYIKMFSVLTTLVASDLGLNAFERASMRDEQPQQQKGQNPGP
jgi:hypothetical protein